MATKVRDRRPKMSSKVRDSGQNVRTHRVQREQLHPALQRSNIGRPPLSHCHCVSIWGLMVISGPILQVSIHDCVLELLVSAPNVPAQ